jgi:GMP synthase (glutamine-hydrolysing)
VICGFSGGLDSSVVAVLLHEAIGEQLLCVFVDHCLLRKDKGADIVRLFHDRYNIPLAHADASEQFLKALAGITDRRGSAGSAAARDCGWSLVVGSNR